MMACIGHKFHTMHRMIWENDTTSNAVKTKFFLPDVHLMNLLVMMAPAYLVIDDVMIRYLIQI
jgi:hypothetical protein